jgi:hypothetical protein
LTGRAWRDTVTHMKSALADYAEQQLIEAARKLTPEQRLVAYMEQYRLVAELYFAGVQLRQEESPSAQLNSVEKNFAR